MELGNRDLWNLVECAAEELPGAIFLTDDVGAIVDAVDDARSCILCCVDGDIDADGALGERGERVDCKAIVTCMGVTCCEVTVRILILEVGSPEVIRTLVILCIDIVIILLHDGTCMFGRRECCLCTNRCSCWTS